MSPPYSSKAVANTILKIAEEKKIEDICLRKLQKIIYYANAWSLVYLDTPLIEEKIEARNFGPAIREIYIEFSDFDDLRTITREATEVSYNNANDQLEIIAPSIPLADEKAIELIRKVLDEYGNLSAEQLLVLTHSAGDPWYVLYNKFKDELLRRSIEIPNSLIKACFNAKLQQKLG